MIFINMTREHPEPTGQTQRIAKAINYLNRVYVPDFCAYNIQKGRNGNQNRTENHKIKIVFFRFGLINALGDGQTSQNGRQPINSAGKTNGLNCPPLNFIGKKKRENRRDKSKSGSNNKIGEHQDFDGFIYWQKKTF